MSRHNRVRRYPQCLNCGMRFHPQSIAFANAYSAAQGRHPLHVCGVCKTLHLWTGEALRLLTPPEEFRLRMRQPKTMDAIARQVCEMTQVPTLTLIDPKEHETPEAPQ